MGISELSVLSKYDVFERFVGEMTYRVSTVGRDTVDSLKKLDRLHDSIEKVYERTALILEDLSAGLQIAGPGRSIFAGVHCKMLTEELRAVRDAFLHFEFPLAFPGADLVAEGSEVRNAATEPYRRCLAGFSASVAEVSSEIAAEVLKNLPIMVPRLGALADSLEREVERALKRPSCVQENIKSRILAIKINVSGIIGSLPPDSQEFKDLTTFQEKLQFLYTKIEVFPRCRDLAQEISRLDKKLDEECPDLTAFSALLKAYEDLESAVEEFDITDPSIREFLHPLQSQLNDLARKLMVKFNADHYTSLAESASRIKDQIFSAIHSLAFASRVDPLTQIPKAIKAYMEFLDALQRLKVRYPEAKSTYDYFRCAKLHFALYSLMQQLSPILQAEPALAGGDKKLFFLYQEIKKLATESRKLEGMSPTIVPSLEEFSHRTQVLLETLEKIALAKAQRNFFTLREEGRALFEANVRDDPWKDALKGFSARCKAFPALEILATLHPESRRVFLAETQVAKWNAIFPLYDLRYHDLMGAEEPVFEELESFIQEYAAVILSCKEEAARLAPQGAIVAMLARGDEQLRVLKTRFIAKAREGIQRCADHLMPCVRAKFARDGDVALFNTILNKASMIKGAEYKISRSLKEVAGAEVLSSEIVELRILEDACRVLMVCVQLRKDTPDLKEQLEGQLYILEQTEEEFAGCAFIAYEGHVQAVLDMTHQVVNSLFEVES